MTEGARNAALLLSCCTNDHLIRPQTSPKIGAAIPAMNCDIRWAESNS